MWTSENWSERMNDDIFHFSFTFSFSIHLSIHLSLPVLGLFSQELASNTAKLLLENQLKYSSRSTSSFLLTWTIVRFAFIHLPPTGNDGRKSNDVRLIGIVVIVIVNDVFFSIDAAQEIFVWSTSEGTFFNHAHTKKEKKLKDTNITLEDDISMQSSLIWGNNKECLSGSVCLNCSPLDKVIPVFGLWNSIIKKRKGKNKNELIEPMKKTIESIFFSFFSFVRLRLRLVDSLQSHLLMFSTLGKSSFVFIHWSSSTGSNGWYLSHHVDVCMEMWIDDGVINVHSSTIKYPSNSFNAVSHHYAQVNTHSTMFLFSQRAH